jgi:hypothetical protein
MTAELGRAAPLTARPIALLLAALLFAVVALAATVRWATIRRKATWSGRATWLPRSLAYGCGAIVLSIMLWSNIPFPDARACMSTGGHRGVLIGQDAGRIVLAKERPHATPHLVVLRTSGVGELLVGPDIDQVPCSAAP